MQILIIVGGILAFFGLVYVMIYNGLIFQKNRVQNAFASMDVMLKQRYDLIPNLLDTVREFAAHEKGLIEGVTALRSQALAAKNPNERANIEKQLDVQMRQFVVSMERYPEVRSNQNYLQLQASLNECEAQIAAARRAYNAAVMDYNNKGQMFPSNIVAGMMDYPRMEPFSIPEVQRENVRIRDL